MSDAMTDCYGDRDESCVNIYVNRYNDDFEDYDTDGCCGNSNDNNEDEIDDD